MIGIKHSPTADSRTCDPSTVSKAKLFESSMQHIQDVRNIVYFLRLLMQQSADNHDADKLTDIDSFYADFQTKFERHDWWDRHRRITRHHLNAADGVPDDVNLIDVLEYIADCVAAGKARHGKVYDVTILTVVLKQAFANTVKLVLANTVAEPQ